MINFDNVITLAIGDKAVETLYIDDKLVWEKEVADHAKTWYKYAGDTKWRKVSITGEISGTGIYSPTTQIPNVSDVVELEIGSDVTSIGGYAFARCTNLTSVTIQDSVTSIKWSAFYGCHGLTSMTIPDSVESIDRDAFHDCTNLASVTIGNNVESIGDEAFSRCTSLTNMTIPDSVTSIGEMAFDSCSGLTSVTIPDSVTSIGVDAFYKCTSVTNVYCYPNPANLTWDEDGKDDFKSDGSTSCHVKAEYLTAYQTKFGDEVNVTFVGDLT